MAFRALLFSKSQETNTALAAVCQSAGLRLDACDDIFAAIEKGTKQRFSCVLVDWSDQPEAGFLIKRARESSPTGNLVVIAIVDREPSAADMRESRLELLIYRPIEAKEAQEVLAKARERMQDVGADKAPDTSTAPENLAARATAAPTFAAGQQPLVEAASGNDEMGLQHEADDLNEDWQDEYGPPRRQFPYGRVCAAALSLVAVFFLWKAHSTIAYLARTPEGKGNVLREAVGAVLSPGTGTPSATAASEPDPYFSRSAVNSSVTPQLEVVSTEAEVSGVRVQLRKPQDFPLPEPVYEHHGPPPVASRSATIPDSLRTAAPITRPVVVSTVTPAQIMAVSGPAQPPIAQSQFSEPVAVSEESERALLVHSVTPAYPPEAAAQKLRGPVVLQATVGRDGSVEDLKIVRGSFVLSKAAIAAVKQWKFQPYTVNGRAAEIQTLLTINFSPPG